MTDDHDSIRRPSESLREESVDLERFCRIATSRRHIERDTSLGRWQSAIIDAERGVRYVLRRGARSVG
ncbi:MAG: hypothetical protein KDB80_00540, partial [Planctomycetes bacterium]|nr:hypothetical protein [Planctomycetota bacterium]